MGTSVTARIMREEGRPLALKFSKIQMGSICSCMRWLSSINGSSPLSYQKAADNVFDIYGYQPLSSMIEAMCIFICTCMCWLWPWSYSTKRGGIFLQAFVLNSMDPYSVHRDMKVYKLGTSNKITQTYIFAI